MFLFKCLIAIIERRRPLNPAKMKASLEKRGANQEKIEAVAVHYNWAPGIKATRMLATLQGQASDVLHEAPKGVTYKGTKGPLKD
jgi:hypothetical protein